MVQIRRQLLTAVAVLGLLAVSLPASAAPVLDVLTQARSFSPNGDQQEDVLDLQYRLSEAANVTVSVQNASGSIVRTVSQSVSAPAGYQSARWDGRTDAGAIAPDGRYAVLFSAAAKSGTSSEGRVAVDIDNRLPGTVVSPTSGSSVSGAFAVVLQPTTNVEVTSLSASLPGCGIGSTSTADADGRFTVRAADSASCTIGSQSLTWSTWWIDRFGSGHSYSGQLPVTVVDDTAPVVELSDYYRNQVITRSSPTTVSSLSYSVYCRDGSDVSRTLVVRDSAGTTIRSGAKAAPTCTGGWSSYDYFSWDGRDNAGTLVADGTYTLTARYTDAAGQATDLDIPATVDTRAPGRLTSPVAGATLSGSPAITVTPEPGRTLTYLSSSLPGCYLGASSTPDAQGRLTLTAAGVAACTVGDQDLTWNVSWRDSFGRDHSYTDTLPVTVVDDTAPVVELSDYYRNQVIALTSPGTTSTASFSASCRDGSAVTRVLTVRDATGATVRTGVKATPTCTGGWSSYDYFDWNGKDEDGHLVPDGAYLVSARYTDAGGHTTDLDLPTTVDTRVPATLTTPAAGASLSGSPDITVAPESGHALTSLSASLPGCYLGSSSSPDAQGRLTLRAASLSTCTVGAQQLSWNLSWRDASGRDHYYSDTRPVTLLDDAAPAVSVDDYYRNPMITRSSATTVADVGLWVRCSDSSSVTRVLSIRNAAGVTVRSEAAGRADCTGGYYGNDYLTWNGQDDDGNLVPDGTYTLNARYTDAADHTTDLELPTTVDTRTPGALTTPSAGSTLRGQQLFEFRPATGFESRIRAVSIWVADRYVNIYNASGDGIWRTTFPVGSLPAGEAALRWSVSWSDDASRDHYFDGGSTTVGVDPTTIPLDVVVTPQAGPGPLSVETRITASDPQGQPLDLTVRWGDGSEDSRIRIALPYDSVVVPHVYRDPGAFSLFVSASNGAGGYAAQTTTVSVSGAANAAPTLQLDADALTGAAPLELNGNLKASDPDGDSLTYTVDYGDGSAPTIGTVAAAGVPLHHRYTRAGVFLLRARISDGRLGASRTLRITAALPEPVSAVAGDDQSGTQDQTFSFDGGGSRPAALLTGYTWDFGDGASGSGIRTSHQYAKPGAYTVTLTTQAGDDRAQDRATVTVLPVPKVPGLAVQVTGDGRPLSGADVAVVRADGVRLTAVSDDTGLARVRGIADGESTVYVWAEGYQPVARQAKVEDGSGELTVALTSGEIGAATLDYQRLTVEEIVERGIDVSAVENQNVYEADVNLFFVPLCVPTATTDCATDPEPVSYPVSVTLTDTTVLQVRDSEPTPVEPCTTCSINLGGYSFYPTVTYVEKQPVIQWLVIPVRASFLKEFFDVSLVVQNLTSGFTFTQGLAGLDLPSGLSLAPTSKAQTAAVEVPDVAGGSSQQVTWTVRGDTEGSYDLSAAYSGLVEPIGKAIRLAARSAKPVEVFGGSALSMTISADLTARRWAPYAIDVTLTNEKSAPVYNASVELKDRHPDAADDEAEYAFAPGTEMVQSTPVIPPGGTFTGTWVVYPGLGNDEVEYLKLVENLSFVKRTGGNVDIKTTIASRRNRLDVAQRNPVQVRVDKHVAAPDQEVITWDAPDVGTRTVERYEIYGRQSVRGAGVWEPLGVVPAGTTSFKVSSQQRDRGRYIAVVTRLKGGNVLYGHQIGVGAARYVALGDSFSAGEGVPAFESETDTKTSQCHRSYGSYSRILAQKRDLAATMQPTRYAACSGATTAAFFDPNTDNTKERRYDELLGYHGDPVAIPAQRDELNEFTDLVTVTMGGNDIGFKDLIVTCLVVDCAAPEAWSETVKDGLNIACAVSPAGGPAKPVACDLLKRITLTKGDNIPANLISKYGQKSVLEQRLTKMYLAMAADAPNAQILISKYPQVVTTTPDTDAACPATPLSDAELKTFSFSKKDRLAARSIVNDLNKTIQTAVDNVRESLAAQGRAALITAVDPYEDFDHLELCSAGQLNPGTGFNALDLDHVAYSYHPNKIGQQAFASAFARVLGGRGIGQALSVQAPLRTTAAVAGTVQVDAHHAQLVATASVPTAQLSLRSPDGQTVTAGSPGVTTAATADSTSLTLDDPRVGSWQIEVADPAAAATPTVWIQAGAIEQAPVVPQASAVVTAADQAGTYVFDARDSTSVGSAVTSYSWRFGDGDPVTGAVATHRFGAGESMTAVLTIVDAAGRSGSTFVGVPPTLWTPPGAPAKVSATRETDGVSVEWTTPAYDGGSPITSYRVTVTDPGGQSTARNVAAADRSVKLPVDLAAAGTYQVTVLASSERGDGPAARASLEVASTEPARLPKTSVPKISGQTRVGGTLTVAPGDWQPDGVSLSVQWFRGDTPIPAGTSREYELTAADLGQSIKVAVTGSLAGYVSETKVSVPTLKVVAGQITSAAPTVSGVARTGQTLRTATGVWAPTGLSYRYQWQRDSTNIAGATAATYTVQPADVGHRLRVSVTGSRYGYAAASRLSDTVTASPGLISPSTPTLAGSAKVGQRLRAGVTPWSPAPITLTYRWYRGTAVIPGAVTSSYLLTRADRGSSIKVMVTGTRAGFTTVTRTSAGSAKVG